MELDDESEQDVSTYIQNIVQKSTCRAPFLLKCVINYNRLYNLGAHCFWRCVYCEKGGDWAEVVGSYSENSCISGSDVDFLCCRGFVYTQTDDIYPENLFGFLVVTDNDLIPPGCCWLRRFRNHCETYVTEDQYFECSASEVDGHTHYEHRTNMDKIVCYRPAVIQGPDQQDYFSSKKFADYHGRKGLTEYTCLNKYLPQWTAHGPAFTQTYFGRFTVDVAISFRCLNGWPESATKWKTRSRCWPPDEMVDEIVKSGFDVVAIPSKISDENLSDLEWRISFRMSETKLILSFNSTQRACFLILKVLVKQFIEPMFPDLDIISTYIMKTVIFWTLEETDVEFWEEKNLLKCLRMCLSKLSKMVSIGNCPNYFIPEYNLFRTKVDVMNERRFSDWLQKELEKDWVILMECEFFTEMREMWDKSGFDDGVFGKKLKRKIERMNLNK